jgi:dienelactone hydrolase
MIHVMTRALPALVMFISAASAQAGIKKETIQYKDGDVELQGHLAWDDSIAGKRPGVLVVHEWWGLNDYARQRAELLAGMGYVAFAVDMYGKGMVTQHAQEAGQWAGQIRANIKAWQERGLAGLKVLQGHALVDPGRIAAIGYCFGGATAMQMAYAGADLAGAVSFHGSLPEPPKEAAGKIKAKILICHGAADSFIPAEQIQKCQKGLEEAKADWQMVSYSGARHSFTNPAADQAGIEGLRYDRSADARSWRHMQDFFKEIFSK